MLRRICSVVCGLCMTAGLVFIIGTVGSSDLGSISFETLVGRSLIGLGVMGFGFMGLRLLDCKYIN